ncbi:MAG TPA: hypothetical protein VHI13_13460 [Candidatus Kapabacteria bacterium]|nr:hypothetical protein [Candidatus Kapabacteria bacterium]
MKPIPLLLALLCAISACSSSHGTHDGDGVDIAAVRLGTRSLGSLLPVHLLDPDAHWADYRTSINDRAFVDGIEERLAHRGSALGPSRGGIFLACVLYRGGRSDTLSFAKGTMMYNGGEYGLDTTLLVMVSHHLPESHQAEIRTFLASFREAVRRQKR